MRFIAWLLPTWLVVKIYLYRGLDFGDAVSYLYMGECIGFEKLLAKWAFWEREYARRGFITLDIDSFIQSGGWGQDLPPLRVKRIGKNSVLHAEIYREKFLGKPVLTDVKPTAQGMVTASYILPSTRGSSPGSDGGPYR